MDARANKNRLIETMRIERARWDMLLVQVDGTRMSTPGVEGQMSVRDILEDLVHQERWLAGKLDQFSPAAANTSAKSEPVDQGRVGSVGDLMAESRRMFEQIVRILMHLSAEDIFSPQRFEWTGGSTVGAVVPGYTLEHYRHYDSAIRRWMTQKRKRNIRNEGRRTKDQSSDS